MGALLQREFGFTKFASSPACRRDRSAFAAANAGDGGTTGLPVGHPFEETVNNFQIEWPSTYQISGDLFVVTERSGRIRRVLGYPTADISRTMGRRPDWLNQ